MQPRDRGRVGLCDGAQRAAPAGAGQAGHLHDILDDHRQPVGRTQRLAARGALVGLAGQPQAFLRIRSFDQRVERGIDALDLRHVCLRDFPAGHRAARHQTNKFVSR